MNFTSIQANFFGGKAGQNILELFFFKTPKEQVSKT